MIENKRILAVIPARGGSKGIPHKNIVDLGGRPLIDYTIQAALGSKYVDRLVVSTDDEEIALVSKACGADVPFLRPDYLSSDTAKSIDALIHAVEFCEDEESKAYDIIVLLQATSPFRDSGDLDGALERFIATGELGVVSMNEVEENPVLIRTMDESGNLTKLMDTSSTVRRQDMKKFYFVNGAIYINNRKTLNRATSLNDNPVGYVMTLDHSIDIDDMSDLEYARFLKN
ncbi:MAG: acylneuraminate cytidylyltransferase family protein [Bacteroidaceae bacterium]|nr:acylneuraminate cytidylyltransferase family protein [Bacteroidaceae bacterium]